MFCMYVYIYTTPSIDHLMTRTPLSVSLSLPTLKMKRLDSDGDDLLSPRDCVKAFKGAAMMVKERKENCVGQEKLKAFLREHGGAP